MQNVTPSSVDSSDNGPCDCELPGSFCAGVPGVLAFVENGKVVPGTVVERCDACQRYESDEAAREKLAELGMLDKIAPPKTYTVYAYAIVWTKREQLAVSARDAARLVSDQYQWEAVRGEAEFADAFHRFVVEPADDEDSCEEFDGALAALPR